MQHNELGRTDHTLSVVVCTYDRYGLLDQAIASLLRQDVADIEIIIVDNSPDQKRAQDHGLRYAGCDRVTYVLEPRPGLSRARNIGIARARGSIVAFIDDDATADPGWAKAIIDTFETFPGNVAAVGGIVAPRWTAVRPEWLTDKLMRYLSIVERGTELRELQRGEWLAGCNIAFRRSVLQAIGGFSEALGRSGAVSLLSNEETQVVDLITASGGIVVYDPRARVEHTIDASRLDELWFCRRAAWQAVSDFLSDPEKSRAHVLRSAGRVSDVIDPSRVPQGTQERVNAIYGLVLSCLAGEAIFDKKLRKRSGSRFVNNLRAIPGKAIRKFRASLSP